MTRKLFVFFSCFSCFLFFLSAAAATPANSQEKTPAYAELLPVIEGQLAAIRSGNLEKAYAEFTSAQFQKKSTLEQFKEFVNKYSVLIKNRSFQFQSFYFEDHIATFQVVLSSTTGEELEAEYDLTNEKGQWKILGIQLFKPETTVPRLE